MFFLLHMSIWFLIIHIYKHTIIIKLIYDYQLLRLEIFLG
jgi:hypothetical protein